MADESESGAIGTESEVPASVSRLMQELDSKWEKRFEASAGLSEPINAGVRLQVGKEI